MKKIIFIIIIAVGAWLTYSNLSPDKAPTKRVDSITNVVVTNTQIMPIRDEVEAIGTGKAYESITVSSKVADIITRIDFNDGDLVKKNAVLVQLNDSEQVARVKLAEVKVQEHRREYDRISTLVKSKVVAGNERDRLQSLIDSTRAELEQAKSSLTDRVITAPFSGRLGLRHVSVGGFVTPGQQISTLDDISQIKVDFSVPERFIQDLQPGKHIEAKAVAFPDRIFKGVVTSIDTRVNPETRAVLVRAVVPNDDFALLPGMLMKIKLIKLSREALLIPESAIIPIQNKHFVYLVGAEQQVIKQPVTIGTRTRGWVEVTSGLDVGQQVIIRGILKVRPGDKVKAELAERFTIADANTEDSKL